MRLRKLIITAIIIAFVATGLVLFLALREPDTGSFDERFKDADERLEALSESMKAQLDAAAAPARRQDPQGPQNPR